MSYNARVRPQKRYTMNAGKFLSDAEAEHLELLARRGLMEGSHRDCVLLLLALRTGARATELLELRRRDFDSHSNTILIRGIKGSNDRELPLPPWLGRALKMLIASTEADLIFDIGYHRLREIWMFYRPCEKPFHALRHTFAIKLYKKEKDIKLVMIALGHRNIANTLVYVDYVYSLHELKRIVY